MDCCFNTLTSSWAEFGPELLKRLLGTVEDLLGFAICLLSKRHYAGNIVFLAHTVASSHLLLMTKTDDITAALVRPKLHAPSALWSHCNDPPNVSSDVRCAHEP